MDAPQNGISVRAAAGHETCVLGPSGFFGDTSLEPDVG
jgi:hypothetical protein